MKLFIICCLCISGTILSYADDIYLRNNYVYKNALVVDTISSVIRAKVNADTILIPISTIAKINYQDYDSTLTTDHLPLQSINQEAPGGLQNYPSFNSKHNYWYLVGVPCTASFAIAFYRNKNDFAGDVAVGAGLFFIYEFLFDTENITLRPNPDGLTVAYTF